MDAFIRISAKLDGLTTAAKYILEDDARESDTISVVLRKNFDADLPDGKYEAAVCAVDAALIDNCFVLDGSEYPNKYCIGKSESNQIEALKRKLVDSSYPIGGFTLKVPPVGGIFVVTVSDANKKPQ